MILNRQRRIPVSLSSLTEFFERARHQLRFPENGVTVQLVSDSAMTRLNRTFRGKNAATDVLSFPAEPLRPRSGAHRGIQKTSRKEHALPSQTGLDDYIGDIAISTEMARRNAQRLSRSFSAELRILLLHGMIHLAGYDHETDSGQMEKLERRLRRRLGLQS